MSLPSSHSAMDLLPSAGHSSLQANQSTSSHPPQQPSPLHQQFDLHVSSAGPSTNIGSNGNNGTLPHGLGVIGDDQHNQRPGSYSPSHYSLTSPYSTTYNPRYQQQQGQQQPLQAPGQLQNSPRRASTQSIQSSHYTANNQAGMPDATFANYQQQQQQQQQYQMPGTPQSQQQQYYQQQLQPQGYQQSQGQLSPSFPRQSSFQQQQYPHSISPSMSTGMPGDRSPQIHQNVPSVSPKPPSTASSHHNNPTQASSSAYPTSASPVTQQRLQPHSSTPTSNDNVRTRPRSRSTGSAFVKVRNVGDLKPAAPPNTQQGTGNGRRANPDGGFVSPIKALTTQLSQTYHLVNPNFRYEFSLNPRRVLTKPSKPAGNDGYDNEDSDYILYVNDVLGSEGNKYLILDVLGQGTFGQVVKCQNMKTHEIVGVKVIKNKTAYYQQSMMEITILEMLNLTYDPEDKHHILRLKDTFVHCRHLCLVFELLSSNLYELIKQNAFRGLSTSLVRVFTAQLLDALCVLKDARLIHCDLKPENILLKTLQSPDIKVIDFGSACHERQTVYTYIQSRFYRSPEVLLGLPYSTSIDMWSLGCICVELFLGLPLFPGTSEFNQITRIVEMLGLPPTYMLETGKQVNHFFNQSFDEYGRKQWRLKTLEEYEREHPNAKEQPSKKFFAANTLPEIIKTYPNQRKNLKQADIDREMSNRISFIDFVQGLLNMNPMERWTPQQAKLHPFVLNEPFRKPFVPPMGVLSSQSSRMSGTPQTASPTATAGNSLSGAAPTPDRPYGGLPPTPQRNNSSAFQDASAYQQHLNRQQAHAAAASASAYRQAQQPTNPYAPQPSEMSPKQNISQPAYSSQRLPPSSASSTSQQQHSRVPVIQHHSPSQSMSYPSTSSIRNPAGGPLSPTIPTNPPPAHHYLSNRGRSGTFSQLDIPPALQKLGLDLNSFTSVGTPQLRREEQRAAWERRNAGGSANDQAALDRRRSLRQANPHLEHLEYYAQSGQPAGYYYASPPSLQQPFSVVVDPRMSDPMMSTHPQQLHQQQPHPTQSSRGYDSNPVANTVQVPPAAYSGAGPSTRYLASIPQHQQPAGQQQQPIAGSGSTPYDAFDQYDTRDGLNSMLHQPLIPQQRASVGSQNAFYDNQQQRQYQTSMYGSPTSSNLPFPGQNPDHIAVSGQTGGKIRKSDAQMWP